MKQNPPCENCILFGICCANLDKPTTYTQIMMGIYKECKLLQRYLDHSGPYSHLYTYEYDPCKVSRYVDWLNRKMESINEKYPLFRM